MERRVHELYFGAPDFVLSAPPDASVKDAPMRDQWKKGRRHLLLPHCTMLARRALDWLCGHVLLHRNG
jgi:hypothetical protein